MSLSRLSLGTLKLSELGIGEGHKVLKFRVGGREVVQCKRLSSFCKGEPRGSIKGRDMK